MKKFFLTLSVCSLALISCTKDESNNNSIGETRETYINATSKTTWSYYSLEENKIVGTGEENEADNALWSARSDWDLAICRYSVRTNGGAFTTIGSKGGVHTFNSSVSFSSVTSLPELNIIEDVPVTTSGMSGETTIIKSAAQVILFKANDDGSLVMPPVYLQAPVYIFRTANGQDYYKVQFTQYQNEDSVTGHVKFNSAKL